MELILEEHLPWTSHWRLQAEKFSLVTLLLELAACTFPATSNKIRETVTNKPCFTNRYILSSSELRVGSNAIFKNVAVVFECPEDGSTAYCVVVYNNHVVVHAAYLIQCSVYF